MTIDQKLAALKAKRDNAYEAFRSAELGGIVNEIDFAMKRSAWRAAHKRWASALAKAIGSRS